ncbi:hypothetical protein ACFORH_43300 [Amycolatopsis roodepoortensis]|uniref:Uncharacterized protein n=1 Tax=Amycolatopsis roodepoortensis TaxID=700274 RepID=A0ABR9LIB0_9PSEU|nr:hypothetical protein [Amycolatopsis roodepoortensis]MBE1580431.1 hypothetical protein [Amycolatopsis roodepoortensis]
MDKATWPAFPVARGADLGDEVQLSPSQLLHDGEMVGEAAPTVDDDEKDLEVSLHAPAVSALYQS